MIHALRLLVLTLGRLNLWIAALLLAGLLQGQQGVPQSHLAQLISAQPVGVLTAAPKFALAKPTTAESRVRLIPLLDIVQAAMPIQPTGFHRLQSAPLPPIFHQIVSHDWQARAPPHLLAISLI